MRIKTSWECTHSTTTSKLWLKSSFQTTLKVGQVWIFGFDLICYTETLLATFREGWGADTKLPKAICCLDWGKILFIHSCNLSTWVVLSPLSPKHHVICLVLIVTSSNFLMWRMCSEGSPVYNYLIDWFHFCLHLLVLLTLFLRKNNYVESGFSRGLFCFMWGTKTCSIKRIKLGGKKSVIFPSTNKSSASTIQEHKQCNKCGH